MSFLLDTDICSAYLKNDPQVASKVMLYFGSLNVSVITVGELLTWGLRANAPTGRLLGIRAFLAANNVLETSLAVAEKFGELRAALLDQGRSCGEMDLLNASTALVHGLTMVTHNTRDYAGILGLTLDDWQVP